MSVSARRARRDGPGARPCTSASWQCRKFPAISIISLCVSVKGAGRGGWARSSSRSWVYCQCSVLPRDVAVDWSGVLNNGIVDVFWAMSADVCQDCAERLESEGSLSITIDGRHRLAGAAGRDL